MVNLGLDIFLQRGAANIRGKRLGLLTNQASVGKNLVHDRLLINERFPGQLTTFFSPQHGFYSEQQDNMIESAHSLDQVTGLPIYSLYGDVRRPPAAMFDDIDILLIDLQDVGTRVYTFVYTVAYCLQTAKECDKKVVILDRPNPIGGEKVEGNLLESDVASFVGLYPLPMRHGLTMGEFALLVNTEFGIGAELDVVPMEGWTRQMYYRDTGLPWVAPSPNMVTPETAHLYPGQVIWEGSAVSEGRGTTRPFELFGAPYIEHEEILSFLNRYLLPDCFFRPLLFKPTSGKWVDQLCTGFQIHVLGREFMPYRCGLVLLQAMLTLYRSDFAYKEPPYEYEFSKLPMDLILGSRKVRLALEQGRDTLNLEEEWQDDLQKFTKMRKPYLLYS